MAKLPLVGLIRLVHYEPCLSGNLFLLLWASFGIAKWHDNCLFIYYLIWFEWGEVLMFFLCLFFTASALVVYMFNGSQSHLTSRVFQVQWLLVSIHSTIIWCTVKIKWASYSLSVYLFSLVVLDQALLVHAIDFIFTGFSNFQPEWHIYQPLLGPCLSIW